MAKIDYNKLAFAAVALLALVLVAMGKLPPATALSFIGGYLLPSPLGGSKGTGE